MQILDFLFDVLKNTLTITCLVMVMLLLIEFINVRSSGRWTKKMEGKKWLQVIFATLLGLIPGCIGGFTIVSLYTHRLFSFGALVAGMISTFGDEAFVIFAYSPKWTLILSAALLGIGVITGLLTDFFYHPKHLEGCDHSFELHDGVDDAHHHTKVGLSFSNIKQMSFARAALLFGLGIYLLAIFTGTLSHEHGAMPDLNATTVLPESHHDSFGYYTDNQCVTECEHHLEEEECDHCEHHHSECAHHHEGHHHHSVWSWENIVFGLLALFTLLVCAFASDHFLQEHLWAHVIKKHFLSVLLWTFGVLLFLKVLYHFVDVNALIAENNTILFVLMLVAVLVGIIPESGPHLIFVVMFFSGAIPFSILLANSVVQDGHGALPLLAESRSRFLLMKSINLIAGLVIGILGYFIGF